MASREGPVVIRVVGSIVNMAPPSSLALRHHDSAPWRRCHHFVRAVATAADKGPTKGRHRGRTWRPDVAPDMATRCCCPSVVAVESVSCVALTTVKFWL